MILTLHLLKRIAVTVLGQRYFPGKIFRFLGVLKAQWIDEISPAPADTASVHTFHEPGDYLPIHEKDAFTFLLSFPHFTSHSLTHSIHLCLSVYLYLSVIFCNILCRGFTGWKASISTYLLWQCAQLPGQLSGSVSSFLAFSKRYLSLQKVKFSGPGPVWPGEQSQCSCACRHWGDFSGAVTWLLRQQIMWVENLSLQHKKKKRKYRSNINLSY